VLTATTEAAVLNVSNTPQAQTITVTPATYAYGTAITLTVPSLFTGQYFNGGNAAPTLPVNGVPALTRLDPLVNFEWGNGSPGTGVNVDDFMVRWQAKVRAPVSGNYTFYVKTDDGGRLYVNGALVVEKWALQGSTEWCGTSGTPAPGTCNTVSLNAGDLVDLRMEYYEHQVGAHAELSWEVPGLLTKQHVAMGQWLHNGVPIANVTGGIYAIGAMTANDVGRYVFTMTDPCSGATLTTDPVVLTGTADFNSDGFVDCLDVQRFIQCVTGPAVLFTPADPCVWAMDMDADGDVDQDDFGLLQLQWTGSTNTCP
jgi:hypothetical protein